MLESVLDRDRFRGPVRDDLTVVDTARERSLALLGDPDARAYELLFSFSSPAEKNEFLNLVRSNEDMAKDYIIEFTPPTEEIRNAPPLGTAMPQRGAMAAALTMKSDFITTLAWK